METKTKMGTINNFCPTPPGLAKYLAGKIRKEVWAGQNELKALDPEAGKGDLIQGILEYYEYGRRQVKFSAIEIDNDLRATLIGKGIQVIDEDFLSYSGVDKFDLLCMNPPFDEGDKHLMKAIEILYRGQILCILNAETIRNPCTNLRKELNKKLKELNAKIEFKSGAFRTAEFPSDVEIAIVDIFIERKVETDLFKDMDKAKKFEADGQQVEGSKEVSTGGHIREMVAEYNQLVEIGTKVIIDYYRHYYKIGKYIGLDHEPDKYVREGKTLTTIMQEKVNILLQRVRKEFWDRCLELREIKSRMTQAEREKFYHLIERQCAMDFTERNIRTFILNLINNYEKILTAAVLSVFDRMTRHGYNDQNKYEENIHYFNGWKTNSAFKVRNKVILPLWGGYGSTAFVDSPGTSWEKWKLHYNVAPILNDIDIVMNYFDGMSHHCRMSEFIEAAFNRGQTREIHSTYFTVTCYKKGTIHMTFNDPDILRRFNVAACKGKGWLPCDYGDVNYNDLPPENKEVVRAFEENIFCYESNVGKPLLPKLTPDRLMLGMA